MLQFLFISIYLWMKYCVKSFCLWNYFQSFQLDVEDFAEMFPAHKIFHEFSMLIHEKFIKHFKILFGSRLRNFSFATV